jgi:hypothetical protein
MDRVVVKLEQDLAPMNECNGEPIQSRDDMKWIISLVIG